MNLISNIRIPIATQFANGIGAGKTGQTKSKAFLGSRPAIPKGKIVKKRGRR